MQLMDRLLRRSKDYKEVFDTPAGKRVLKDLIQFTQYTVHPFTPGDPSTTSWVLGKQVVAKRIIGFVQMSDEDIKLLMKSGDEEKSHSPFDNLN